MNAGAQALAFKSAPRINPLRRSLIGEAGLRSKKKELEKISSQALFLWIFQTGIRCCDLAAVKRCRQAPP
jgi:hypothetical protein